MSLIKVRHKESGTIKSADSNAMKGPRGLEANGYEEYKEVTPEQSAAVTEEMPRGSSRAK